MQNCKKKHNSLIFPLPNSLHKLFSSKVMTRGSLLPSQFLFHSHLCSYTCMVAPWHPQCCATFHSVPEGRGLGTGCGTANLHSDYKTFENKMNRLKGWTLGRGLLLGMFTRQLGILIRCCISSPRSFRRAKLQACSTSWSVWEDEAKLQE